MNDAILKASEVAARGPYWDGPVECTAQDNNGYFVEPEHINALRDGFLAAMAELEAVKAINAAGYTFRDGVLRRGSTAIPKIYPNAVVAATDGLGLEAK